jgi:hypothetical protein
VAEFLKTVIFVNPPPKVDLDMSKTGRETELFSDTLIDDRPSFEPASSAHPPHPERARRRQALTAINLKELRINHPPPNLKPELPGHPPYLYLQPF